MNGSVTQALRGFGRRATRNRVRAVAGCWAASVLCVIIFLGFGAQPHSSILALDIVGVAGVFFLALGMALALFRRLGFWWAFAIALAAAFAVFGPAIF